MMTKQQLANEHRIRELELQKGQKELFEHALQKAVGDQHEQTNTKPLIAPSVADRRSTLQYYESIEQEIQQAAIKKAAEFVSSKAGKSKCTKEQALQVYSILLLPEEILNEYM